MLLFEYYLEFKFNNGEKKLQKNTFCEYLNRHYLKNMLNLYWCSAEKNV